MNNCTKTDIQSHWDSRKFVLYLHSFIMIYAWLFAAPLSIFIVKYYRHKTRWLTFHAALAKSTVIGVSSTAFTFITSRRRFLEMLSNPHAFLGIVILVLSGFQLVLGFICAFALQHNSQNSKKKLIFFNRMKICHRIVGPLLLMFGIFQCIMGVNMLFTIGMRIVVYVWILAIIILFIYNEFHWRKLSHNISNKINIFEELQHRITRLNLPTFSHHEFRSKITTGSRWVIVANAIIDISDWIDVHPGGAYLLRSHIGLDVTEEFIGGEIKALNDINNNHIENKGPNREMTITTTTASNNNNNNNNKNDNSKSKIKSSHRHSISAMTLLATRVRGRIVMNDVNDKSIVPIKEKIKDTITFTKLVHKEHMDLTIAPVVKFVFEIDIGHFDDFIGCHYKFLATGESFDIFERPYTPIESLANELLLSQNSRNSKSNSSSGAEKKKLIEFYIRLYPNGEMSKFLSSLSIGESRLRLSGPHVGLGTTKLRNIIKTNEENDHILYIVGGTGIVVFLQMLSMLMETNIYTDVLWQSRELTDIFECPLLEKHLIEGRCNSQGQKYLQMHYIITLTPRPPTHLLHDYDVNKNSTSALSSLFSSRNQSNKNTNSTMQMKNRKKQTTASNNMISNAYVVAADRKNAISNSNKDEMEDDTIYEIKRKLTNKNKIIQGTRITTNIIKEKFNSLLSRKEDNGDGMELGKKKGKACIILSGPVRFTEYIADLLNNDDELKDIELIRLD
jgi:cytochrome b involved in lipid metabolism